MSTENKKIRKITPEMAEAVSNKIKKMQGIEYEEGEQIDLLDLEGVSGGAQELQAAWKITWDTSSS